MSVAKEKKFVIKHVFNDVRSWKNEHMYSKTEKHFNFNWFVWFYRGSGGVCPIFLNCSSKLEEEAYTIKADIGLKLLNSAGEENWFSERFEFTREEGFAEITSIGYGRLEDYLTDGNLTVECHVAIHEMTGIKVFLVSEKFDGSNKEFSDVVLIVDDQKFHVMKQYLAFHSSYFKALLFGNFEESKQSEVELKDIDPQKFQNYLNIIYGESSVEDGTVEGILHLADFFDSKTAIRRCEEFLLEVSQKTLEEKFELADKYKLDELMKQCLSDMKTAQDIRSIRAEEEDVGSDTV